jgi:hypothetical protein
MRAAPHHEQPSSLAARLEQVERLLAEQQEWIATQEVELVRLRAVGPGAGATPLLPVPVAPAARAVVSNRAAYDAPPTTPDERPTRRTRSRRALLKLGGAVAAAGVAAVAAGAQQEAQAATGGTFILGQSNNADATTTLVPTVATTPGYLLKLDTSSVNRGTGMLAMGGTNGIGVIATAVGTAGHGVLGTSDSGFGVVGGSITGIDLAADTLGRIWQNPQDQVGPPSSGGPYQQGESIRDHNGALWLCTESTGPTSAFGTWVRVVTVPNGTLGGGTNYLSTPVRLLDARPGGGGSGLVNRGPLAANELYPFLVAGLNGSGIPASAQGLIANVTVLGPSGAGNLSLFPAGGAIPTVASMTFGSPGLFLANGVNVAIGTGGLINIQNQSGDITPLVLDAVAYVG